MPVLVAYDGFFTSHQKRRVYYFEDRKVVQDFIGDRPSGFPHALDPANPVTIGPYMNDPDLINNNYQQSLAMYRAGEIFKELAAEYKALSGRDYPALDLYEMDDAEVALFLINSAADTAKVAADKLRKQGIKAGVISPNIIRPFPAEEIRNACKNLKALLVGERADSYGGHGANITHEIKSALQDDKENKTIVLCRIFGVGGKDFYVDDAEAFYRLTIQAAEKGYAANPFDYFGHTPGYKAKAPKRILEPLYGNDFKSGLIKATLNEDTGKLEVKIPPLRQLAGKPKRIAPGHGACPGCGIFPGLELFFKGIEGDIVTLFHTGCAMVVTTGYPYSSHKQTYIHNLFQNGAATLSGTVEMFYELKRRREIEFAEDPTFIMITGDGGMDIGMGPAIGG